MGGMGRERRGLARGGREESGGSKEGGRRGERGREDVPWFLSRPQIVIPRK